MLLSEEFRQSETKNRTAAIFPYTPMYRNGEHYTIILTERGRVLRREYKKRANTLTEARKVAREWCA